MKNRFLYTIIIIIMFIAFCGSQLLIYEQNKVIEEYSDLIDAYVEAYGQCMGGKFDVFKDQKFREVTHGTHREKQSAY